MKLSIVVPCYNEAKNIPLILQRFNAAISRDDVEVILVNNGSVDNSHQVLEELLPAYPFARSVNVPVNQGYGYGILQGLAATRGEYLGWTHADMQTDPADVLRALDVIDSVAQPENCYVKGARQGRKWSDNIFTIGMSAFETIYLRKALWDINAQPNIFSRQFYQTWQNPPHDFSLDLYVYYCAKRANLVIKRIPVQFPERVHGVSSWNTSWQQKWKFIVRTLTFSKSLKLTLPR